MAILNLLTTRPDGASLTEIAAEVGATPSTMVHVLAALTSAGYLFREPADRRYHLGPALVEPGRVAAARYPALALARREMVRLSERFGAPCFAFVRDGRWARLAHTTSDPHQPGPRLRIGELIPVVPPLATVFMAWAAEDDVAAWLAADPSPAPGRAAALRALLARARARGYVVEGPPEADEGEALLRTLQEPPSPRRDHELRRMLSRHDGHVVVDIDPATTYRTTGVGAPVFEPSGAVGLSITVATYDLVLTGAELAAVGEAVRAAAATVAAAL